MTGLGRAASRAISEAATAADTAQGRGSLVFDRFIRALIAHAKALPLVRLLTRNGGAVLSVCGLAVLWAGVLHGAAGEREQALLGARQNTQNLARAFEETTARTLRAVDQSMLFLRDAYRRDPAGFDAVAWARDTQSITDITFQVSRIDRNGMLATSNFAPTGDRIDLSDRAHFRIHRDTPGDFLYISQPVLGRASNKWSIQLTRKIYAPDGGFDGVFVISLDPEYLSRFFDHADIGRSGMVILAGTDGVIRAAAMGGGASPATMSPSSATPPFGLGRSLADGPLRRAIAAAGSGTTIATSGLDDIPRVESFRAVEALPLVVAVGVSLDDVLATARRNLARDCLVAGLLTILLLAITVVMLRREAGLARAREALRASEAQAAEKSRLLEATLEAMSQGIVMVDSQSRAQVVNRRAMELLDLGAGDIQGEHLPLGIAGPTLEQPGDDSTFIPAAGGALVTERRMESGLLLEVRTCALADGGIVQTYTDITARAAAEEMLGLAAGHDHLTGLVNRNGFAPKLEQALATAQRLDLSLHVLCLDLDHFKTINDTHGHATGDTLLKQVAQRMRDVLRATDIIARLGGDEFAIVLTDQSFTSVRHVAEMLIASLSLPFTIQNEVLRIGVSIGIAAYPADGAIAEQLLHTADVALYQAKAGGRNVWRAYASQDGARERLRASLLQDVQTALDTTGFTLAYQPICDVVSGRPLAFEALLRWDHPTRGPVSPAEFIPMAEETGLIVRLSRWVIEQACADAVHWPHHIGLCVNLSPAWFRDPDLAAHTREVLQTSGLAAERLSLEVTEGVMLDETAPTLRTMRTLRGMGVRMVLDDFGSAHASLSYLRGFPFDLVKIDRSFMRALNTDHQARALVEAMLTMAHALGLAVVAEGVETPEQLTMLRHLACDRAQGFLLGAPMPAAEVVPWLRQAGATTPRPVTSF